MHRLIFQNSKIALAFAILTIVGAVSMVGTPDDTGVVAKAAAFAKASGDYRAAGPASTSASRPAAVPVFGEYGASASNAEEDGDTLVVEPLK